MTDADAPSAGGVPPYRSACQEEYSVRAAAVVGRPVEVNDNNLVWRNSLQDQRYFTAERRATICLIMDVANIAEESIMPLVQELRRRGDLAAMFAFADWHRRDMHLRHRLLDALGFLCIHGGSWENGSGGLKSTVDSIMKRAIKWMPQWFPNCDTYVLATGDRDFAHDASDLRWRGLRVWIAAGETSINNELRLGADEFISLDKLPGRATPSALLGVPANYYEMTFGGRARPFRGMPNAPSEPVSAPPAPPSRRSTLASRSLAGTGRGVPPPPPVPVTTPVVSPPPPAPVVTATPPPAANGPAPALAADELAVLNQLRTLMGDQGFVAQREALRALAPVNDPGGRVRSRLSNQIRELVEGNQLTRSQIMLGGNLTQVLALPGVTVEPTVVVGTAPTPVAPEVAPPPEAADDELGGDRRGRPSRLRRRGGRWGNAEPYPSELEAAPLVPPTEALPSRDETSELVVTPAASAAPLVEVAPAPPSRPSRPTPVVPEPVVPEPVTLSDNGERPALAESGATMVPPPLPPVSEPAMVERRPERRSEPRSERSARPAASAPEPAAAPVSRPSWREAVAAALAQVRGETAPAPTARVAPAPPVNVAAPATSEVAVPVPPVSDEPAVAEPDPPVPAMSAGPAAEPAVAPAVVEPLVPATTDETPEAVEGAGSPPARRRRRRRTAGGAANGETAAEAAPVEVVPEPVVAEPVADETGGADPARRRPRRRPRRPAGEAEAPASE